MRNINSLITVLALSFASVSVGCATSGSDVADEYSDAESSASAPGTVDLWKASNGQFYFHVVAGNGRILLTSEGYTARTGALNGLLSVLENGVDPAQYQKFQTASGKWSLHLRAANYETIAFTEAYSSKSNATRAVTSCVNAVTSYLDQLQAPATGARVEVFATETGFHFNLHAQNGEIVLSSEKYNTAAAAWNGAFAIQDASHVEGAFAIKTSTDGRFYFTLTAENGQVVGVSQMYTAKASAEAGIKSVTSLLSSMDMI